MSNRIGIFVLSALLLPFFTILQACSSGGGGNPGIDVPEGVESLAVEIVAAFPHDRRAYTQGLLYENGWVYESTGKNRESGIRSYRPGESPDSIRVALPDRYFGEGIAKIGSRIFMLTWRAGRAFVFESGSFRQTGEFNYTGEGWGLCHDGRWLIMSDGSDILTYRDPADFGIWKSVPVRLGEEPVYALNELEFAGGAVYANVWQRDYLVRIDPASGKVTAVIDASSLPYRSRVPGDDVLNGIAYKPETDTFLLTGKLWPEIYEVRLVPAD